MKQKKVTTFLILLIVVLSISSCRKSKFEHFDNIINVTLPEECMGKNVYITLSGEDEGVFGYQAGSVSYVDADDNLIENKYFSEYDDKHIELVLDWTILNHSPLNPGKSVVSIIASGNGLKSDDPYADYYIVAQHSLDFKPKSIYNYDPDNNIFEDTGENTERKNLSYPSNLQGTWKATSGTCTDKNKWNFSDDGDGYAFVAVCGVTGCAESGIYYHFKYKASDGSISLDYPDYDVTFCGVSEPYPDDESVNYSISGDILTINGVEYKKE